MTSMEEFKCVFCDEIFSTKEELQIHFRKHADPSFNASQKNKSRPQSETQANEPRNEEVEMVNCDVCTEVFPTISKAITHKHKVHPDHDAKYFCPWCGKLFTMKHLYNKHMQSTHDNMERSNSINFHCDICNVDFYIVAAMLYHNKFFHRQDADLAITGQSKKLKKINQEVLQIYYCAFCGDEYDNKVNLYKHVTEEHNDENQRPEEILHCPLCEAIFYHLDAYEIHLTFHSAEDLYSEKNEMVEQITDFSLETVAPVIEKAVNADDVETTMNAVGIEKFLEMVMDNSLDDNDQPKKSKKRKKHKKSKKSAITLDEFLNMNKDVFGEGIDIQGVEEVPTQMVAKRLNTRKVGRPPKKQNITELEKLKKQGIVVKMKPTKKVPLQVVKVKGQAGETAVNIPKKCAINHHTTETKTPNDVISKLMNQSNSQIKIVKKNCKDNSYTDQQTNFCSSESPTGKSTENILRDSAVTSSTSSDTEKLREYHENNLTEALLLAPKEHKPPVQLNLKNDELPQAKQSQVSYKNRVLEFDSVGTDLITTSNKLKDDKTSTSKKIESINTNDSAFPSKENSKSGEYDSDPISHGHNSDEELSDQEPNNVYSGQEHCETTIENKNKNDSLTALKHLSHLITIKSVSPKGSLPVDSTIHDNDDNETVKTLCKPEPIISHKNTQKVSVLSPAKEESYKSLKSINKKITVKPLSHSPKISDEHSLSDEVINRDNTVKSTLLFNRKQINVQSKTEQPDITTDSEESQSTNINLLKRLTNITAKPISGIKNDEQCFAKNRHSLPNEKPVQNKIKENQVKESIEIFNIDDSDSDETDKNSVSTKPSSNVIATASHPSIGKFQTLNKNITLKTMNKDTTVMNKGKSNFNDIVIKREFPMSDFSDEEDHDQNTLIPTHPVLKSCLSSQAKIQNTLKNLSKNITVKSGNSSPSMSVKVNNKNIMLSQNEQFYSYDESDDDSIPSNVRITELNDSNLSEDDISQLSNKNHKLNTNVVVQSPDDSNSDNDENYNDDTDDETPDFERQRKVNTINNPNRMKSFIDNKQINKNIIIKKVSKEQNPLVKSGKKTNILPNNKELSIKPFKQTKSEAGEQTPVSKKTDVVHANNQPVTHNETSNIQTGSVNKEVTVKTLQTQTVIQEITTTVTKTIKTVNQTVKQQLQTINSQPLRFQKVQGLSQNNCINPVAVRQRAPTAGTKVRGMIPTRPPQGNTVRPCNQLVPVRPALCNSIRPGGPRMPSVKKITPAVSNHQTIVEGKPKMSSTALVAKRPSEETVSHFSCFKKPKESLIPISDLPTMDDDDDDDDSSNYFMASQSTSNFSSFTKAIKGNSVVTSTQMKSEASCSSQQLSKLNNISGLKIVKTSQSKQSVQTEEKSELSASKRNTLEAIEKLQKQGLIKKPRIESPNENDFSEEDA